MRRRAAARRDDDLSLVVRATLDAPELATLRTLGALPRSQASLTNAARELRLEPRTPISDQGDLGSCYANAWCDAMELLQPKGRVVQLSRLFCWYNARLAHGDEDRDEGTFGAVVSSRQRTLGVCRESTWDYDPAKAFTRPPLSAYGEAYDHRAGVSYVLPRAGMLGRLRAVQGHLDRGYPVVASLAVSDAWDDPDETLDPPKDDEVVGYHAVILDGYVELSDGDVRLHVRNSWGAQWGDDGGAYLSSGYLSSRVCDRLDVVTLSPDFGGSR